MYTGIKHLHSSVAYLVLLLILIAIIYFLNGWLRNKPFNKTNKRLALFSLIAIHTQVVFGILLYFLSPLGFSNFTREAMSNSIARLFILEHPLIMIISAILITIGYSKSKKKTNSLEKHKVLSIFYVISLLLILSRVPWSYWF